jgi:hypothetical protein
MIERVLQLREVRTYLSAIIISNTIFQVIELFHEDDEFQELQKFALMEGDWAALEMFRNILLVSSIIYENLYYTYYHFS